MAELKDKTSCPVPLIILLITLLGLLLRLYFFENNWVEVNQDPYVLSMVAEGMLRGELALKGLWGSRLWPTVQPLYPLLMALLSKVTGDFILSGKIISLLAGVATIPLVYLLWNTLDSKEVAVLASGLVAVNYVHWFYSVHAYRDTFFLLLVMTALLLFYRSLDCPERLLPLAIVLVLATFTREEGYLLTISLAIAYLCWKQRGTLKKKISIRKKEIFWPIIIYLVPIVIWNLYRYTKTGSFVPKFVQFELEYHKAYGGFQAVSQTIQSISWPLFLLALYGVYLVHHHRKGGLASQYLPVLGFVLLDLAAIAWFVTPDVRRALSLIPLLIGFSCVGIVYLSSWIKNRRLRTGVLCAVFISSLGFGALNVYKMESVPEPYFAVKEAMEWFNENSEKDAKILAGEDRNVFGYYTDRQVIGGGEVLTLYAPFAGSKGVPLYVIPAFLISEDIHFLAPYDSSQPGIFGDVFLKVIQKHPEEGALFEYNRIIIEPDIKKITIYNITMRVSLQKQKVWLKYTFLRKFERYNQTVYLYRVDWEKR